MGNKNAIFDHYDGVNEFASLADRCIFCDIIKQAALMRQQDDQSQRQLLHEDELCVIFRDIKNRATAHYQCIPKRHIKNFTRLRLVEEMNDGSGPSPDLVLLRHME